MEQFTAGQKVWAKVEIPTEKRSESYAAQVIRYHAITDMYLCTIWDSARWFHPSELTPQDEEE